MYYEEQVINGVLCWRSTPSGEWVQKTPEQLTAMLLEARQAKQQIDVVYEPAPYWMRPGFKMPVPTCGGNGAGG